MDRRKPVLIQLADLQKCCALETHRDSSIILTEGAKESRYSSDSSMVDKFHVLVHFQDERALDVMPLVATDVDAAIRPKPISGGGCIEPLNGAQLKRGLYSAFPLI